MDVHHWLAAEMIRIGSMGSGTGKDGRVFMGNEELALDSNWRTTGTDHLCSSGGFENASRAALSSQSNTAPPKKTKTSESIF